MRRRVRELRANCAPNCAPHTWPSHPARAKGRRRPACCRARCRRASSVGCAPPNGSASVPRRRRRRRLACRRREPRRAFGASAGEVGADGWRRREVGPQLGGGGLGEAGGRTAGEADDGRPASGEPRVPAADDAPSSAVFEVAEERKRRASRPCRRASARLQDLHRPLQYEPAVLLPRTAGRPAGRARRRRLFDLLLLLVSMIFVVVEVELDRPSWRRSGAGGGGGRRRRRGGAARGGEAEPPNETRRRAAVLDAPRLKGDDDDFLPSQGGEADDGGAIWEAEQPMEQGARRPAPKSSDVLARAA